MRTPTPHDLPCCASANAVSGCWKLGEGRALTLRPSRAGVLRVAHGRMWVTFDHAAHDDAVRGGDHFLGAGEVLHLLPGQKLVLEPWGGGRDSAAYFSWDPLPATAGVTVADARRRLLPAGAAWQIGVAQPLRDLRLALGLAASASGRLLLGLAGGLAAAVLALVPRFATDLIAGRARGGWAARAFRAQSRASRAHGAIS